MVDKRLVGIQHIGELIRERNIILRGADVLTAKGFTQVPNHVLKSEKISPGAKLAYTMLLSYAWQNDYCFQAKNALLKIWGQACAAWCATSKNWSSTTSSK